MTGWRYRRHVAHLRKPSVLTTTVSLAVLPSGRVLDVPVFLAGSLFSALLAMPTFSVSARLDQWTDACGSWRVQISIGAVAVRCRCREQGETGLVDPGRKLIQDCQGIRARLDAGIVTFEGFGEDFADAVTFWTANGCKSGARGLAPRRIPVSAERHRRSPGRAGVKCRDGPSSRGRRERQQPEWLWTRR